MRSNIDPGPEGPVLFSFITLGCKSNQYDSAAMAAWLEKAGMSQAPPSEADVIVINTCMVTGPTEAQCRKAIRQARRASAGARLVVSGCMASGARDRLEAMEEVDLVIGPSEMGSLADLLGVGATGVWEDWPEDPAVGMQDRDRGFLKVQEGCDGSCSYCIVPHVRGRSRSLPPGKVVTAVSRLMEQGAPEVVLSGIHLGQYGMDLLPVAGLEELLEMLLAADPPGRLRLSSIEPLEITERLVRIIADSRGRICRHVHIPLQSGSDRILSAMNRPYRRSDFTRAVNLLGESIPGIGVGCDVICGFPGETDEDFMRTLEIVEKLQIPFLHAFPFSARPGTPAAALPDDVPHRVKKERVRQLRLTAENNLERFARRFVGKEMEIVLESRNDQRGRRMGLADNYLRMALDQDPGSRYPGGVALVRITGHEGGILLGQSAGKTLNE